MQIVIDGGADLTPTQMRGIDLHLVPQRIQLDGKTYRAGLDIQSEMFYTLLSRAKSFPVTSEPSVADFLESYRALAANDPEILSIHISSGLSKTYENAREAANQIKEAHITLVDSKTVSGAMGWQIEAAARATKAGWSREEIMPLVKLISDKTDVIYTLATLKYLIHGGRINHLRGLLGSLMDIKPLIGIDREQGINKQLGSARSLQKAVLSLVDIVLEKHEAGSEMRFQIFHGDSQEMAELLADHLGKMFKCTFLPTGTISPLLGAHTGPGLVGLTYAPQDVFSRLPWANL
jgi:DegV family protein with EDD domain